MKSMRGFIALASVKSGVERLFTRNMIDRNRLRSAGYALAS
jgi:hypothetical protein